MRLEILLPFHVIASFAEKQMQKQLAQQATQDESGAITVIPRSVLQATGQGDSLELRVQVDVEGKGLAGIMPAFFRLLDGGKESRPLLKLNITLVADWQIQTDWQWLPVITAGWSPVEGGKSALPGAMRGLAEPLIDSSLETVAKEITMLIQGSNLLRSLIAPAWEALDTVFMLMENPPIALVLQPSGEPIAYQALVQPGRGVALWLGDKIVFKVGVGIRPEPRAGVLPDGNKVGEIAHTSARVEVEIAMHVLTDLARQSQFPLQRPLPALQVVKADMAPAGRGQLTVRLWMEPENHKRKQWEIVLTVAAHVGPDAELPAFLIQEFRLVNGPRSIQWLTRMAPQKIRKRIQHELDTWMQSQWKVLLVQVKDSMEKVVLYPDVVLQVATGKVCTLDLYFEQDRVCWNLAVEAKPTIVIQAIPDPEG